MTEMTETEETLRYWLAQEDWYPSRYTQDFLDKSPVTVANETLSRIADDAQPEPHSYLAMLYTAFATIGFMPSAGGKIPRRKAGVRAALLLAERNDPRCLPALIRVFETDGVWQNKYQEQIVTALTRYLNHAAESGEGREHASGVERLLERVWLDKPNKELPPALARLLLSGIQFLHTARLPASILNVIAKSEPKQDLRVHVRDKTRSLLDNDTLSR